MLKDCLEIFNEQLEQTEQLCGDGDHLILDTYVPADGDYLIVHKDGKVEKCTVMMDKKTRTVQTDWDEASDAYYQLKFYDYHSRLVSMDKPQDPKKVIHSNNYCAFWVKWESFENGKMDMQALDRYFDVLKNPAEKYKKPQDRKMYDYILDQVGEVDQEKLEQHRDWLKEHLFCLDELGLNLKKKNYLKVFFEEEESLYTKEEQRYLVTKIFNKNDYNMELDDQILGLPNDNLGLNAKKPFLENKTRKVTIPYMITTQEALQQRKFFDYLMNQANLGCMNIFFDYEKKINLSIKDYMLLFKFIHVKGFLSKYYDQYICIMQSAPKEFKQFIKMKINEEQDQLNKKTLKLLIKKAKKESAITK